MSKSSEKKTGKARADGFSDHELQETHGRERKGSEGLFLPFFLFLMVCTWFTWAGVGLSADANSFSLHPDREMTPDELAAAEARAKARMAERLYATYCGACHQPNGRGIPGTYPPLDGSEWLDDGKRVVSLTSAGLLGRIEVMGQAYDNPTGMPAIAKTANLKPEQIVTIVNYVRSSWSNVDKKYPEVMVEDAEEAIQALGDRSIPWTPQELLQEYPFGGGE